MKVKYLNDNFVPSDLAKTLCDFGYDEECFGVHAYNGEKLLMGYNINQSHCKINFDGWLAPTWHQGISFILKKINDLHDSTIKISVRLNHNTGEFMFDRYSIKYPIYAIGSNGKNTDCLKKLIELYYEKRN